MRIAHPEPSLLFQALSDFTRVRILRLLCIARQEVCLCELVDCLLEPEYKLSRHLKVLGQAGILASKKEGRWVYHRLVQGLSYLDYLFEAIERVPDDSKETFSRDLKLFNKRVSLRTEGRCQVGIQHLELMARET